MKPKVGSLKRFFETENLQLNWPRKKMKKFKQLKFQRVSLVAQMVKNPPAIRETWVQSQVWDDPLEESMANPVQ